MVELPAEGDLLRIDHVAIFTTQRDGPELCLVRYRIRRPASGGGSSGSQ